jgi:hypothetical protein
VGKKRFLLFYWWALQNGVLGILGTIGSNNFENSQFYLIMQKKAINTYDHYFIFILTKKILDFTS